MTDIAVLIPVYNDQAGLDRTLASLLDSRETADVIVVDDGSEPPIRATAGVRVLRSTQNGGVTKALNHGLKAIMESGYHYVARLDAGDIALPGRFKAQAAFLDEYPNHAVVGCYVAHVSPEGETLFVSRPPCDHRSLARYMRRRNGFDHPAVMVRVDALKMIGVYDENHCGAEDYELWRRLSGYYLLANLPEIYVRKEVTPTQITARPFRSWARFKVQLRYFEPLRLHAWLGIVRTMLALCSSRGAVIRAKQMLYRIRTTDRTRSDGLGRTSTIPMAQMPSASGPRRPRAL